LWYIRARWTRYPERMWYMPGERTSVYLAADLAASVKASGTPLAELIRRGPAAETAHLPAPGPASPSLVAIADGEPSHGVLCAGPGCWERNTSKYGLRQVPLCPACAAALRGEAHQREIPPGAARLVRRGAA
jgi:hypothetical protein